MQKIMHLSSMQYVVIRCIHKAVVVQSYEKNIIDHAK